jgi:hypothetical protein
MKSMFYGGAAAAVAGLILGAGFKTPSGSFDVRGAQDHQPYTQNADFPDEPSQPAASAPAAYQPEYLNGVAYASAAYEPAAAYAPEPEDDPTPAVYTVEEAWNPQAEADLAGQAASSTPPPRLLLSEAPVEEPQPVAQDQGFYLVDGSIGPS